MRKIILIVLVLFIVSCSRDRQFRISGNLDSGERPVLYFEEQEVTKITFIDSTRTARNGNFVFKGKLDHPRFFQLRLGENKLIPLLIAPGEKIELQCDTVLFSTGYRLSGSEGSLYLKELNAKLANTQSRIDSLVKQFDNTGDTSMTAKLELIDNYNFIVQDQRNYSITFIIDHRQSMASLYALYQRIDSEKYILNDNKDVQLLKITAHSLDTLYPESQHVRALSADARKLEEQLTNAEYTRLIDELEPSFPEISLPDPGGDTISLSSVNSKAILLSFWASWNPASIAHNIELKKIYQQYHSKGFEIYQVSMDNDKDSWLRAIEYDELPWINVSELSYPESYAATVYNVSILPTTFLVTPDGEILGKNLSAGEMNRRLASMLN